MKRFIQTLKNIYKIDELRKRIGYTLGLILIYRFGSYVTIPGVDPQQLMALKNQSSSGLLGLLICFPVELSAMLQFSLWVLCPIFQPLS